MQQAILLLILSELAVWVMPANELLKFLALAFRAIMNIPLSPLPLPELLGRLDSHFRAQGRVNPQARNSAIHCQCSRDEFVGDDLSACHPRYVATAWSGISFNYLFLEQTEAY